MDQYVWLLCELVEQYLAKLQIVAEQACTALENDWETPPNPLMHPPCQCPKCKVIPVATEDGTVRLRISGKSHRPVVREVELSSNGHELLG
ncbi:MAG: hypothetical protein L7S47_02930 [Acidimicrobiales bacterium]|nr:hypothetical protein [Acidimicrobiales bacterium]